MCGESQGRRGIGDRIGARPVERAVAQHDSLRPPRTEDRLFEMADRGPRPPRPVAIKRVRDRGTSSLPIAPVAPATNTFITGFFIVTRRLTYNR